MNEDYGYETKSKSSFYPMYDVQFAEKLPDDLLCDNCKKPALKAVQTECGHRLCGLCYDALRLQEVPRCPLKEADCVIVDEVYPDFRVLKKLLMKLVYCVNKTDGCGEKMLLKELEDHRSICQEELVKCTWPGCEENVLRKELKGHEKTCDYRSWTCPDCELTSTENRKKIHLSTECSERPTESCPFCKDDVLYSEKKLQHHLSSCPSKRRFCSNKHCNFEGTLLEIDEHEKASAGYHKLLELQFDLESLAKDLNEKFNNCEDRVEIIEKANQHQFNTQESEVNQVRKALEHQNNEIIELRQQFDIHRRNIEKKLTELQTDLSYLKRQAPSAAAPMTSTFSRFSDLDIREFPSFESKFVWVLDDFTRKKEDSASGRAPQSIYSPPFYTSRFGYKMCGRLYLNGDGSGRGTHISLFFAIMKGPYDSLLPWPFQQEVKLILLAQDRSNSHIKETFMPDAHSNSFRCPTENMNVASGCPKFVDFSLAKSTRYLKDDTLMFKIEVNRKGLQN